MTSTGENTVKVFKLDSQSRYGAILASPALIIASIFMIRTFSRANLGLAGDLGVIFFSVALAGGVLFLAFYPILINRNRVEIDATAIRYIGFFKTRVMPFREVKGWQTVYPKNLRGDDLKPYITIVSANPHLRTMTIPFDYERMDEMRQSLSFLPSLAAVGAMETAREVYRRTPGETPEEKVVILKGIHGNCLLLNRVSIIAAIYAAVWPVPYMPVIMALIFLPVIAVFVVHRFRGMVGFGGDAFQSPRSTVLPAFLIPSVALCFRAFMDWAVLDWSPLRDPLLLIGVATFLLLFRRDGIRGIVGNVLFYALLSVVYSVGVTVFLNKLLAWSPMVRVVY